MTNSPFVAWRHYLRDSCPEIDMREDQQISGVNGRVQFDESFFIRRKYNVRIMLPEQWVFGGVEQNSNECFMELVPNRTRAVLFAIIRRKFAQALSLCQILGLPILV